MSCHRCIVFHCYSSAASTLLKKHYGYICCYVLPWNFMLWTVSSRNKPHNNNSSRAKVRTKYQLDILYGDGNMGNRTLYIAERKTFQIDWLQNEQQDHVTEGKNPYAKRNSSFPYWTNTKYRKISFQFFTQVVSSKPKLSRVLTWVAVKGVPSKVNIASLCTAPHQPVSLERSSQQTPTY